MVQYTRKAINEGFIALLNERPFDKISVVDIAEKCGITRNTFYYHYADIYALVDEIFRNDTERLINQNVDCNTWQEAVIQATD
ncbi:MAG: TetR/AcrR family transcriptional regulator, partial [Clostridiaceae bacterium]|nr:TetR/AcrR family transcriptional regulator [Clostridiaceae bacterium]